MAAKHYAVATPDILRSYDELSTGGAAMKANSEAIGYSFVRTALRADQSLFAAIDGRSDTGSTSWVRTMCGRPARVKSQ
jgi:hypothetical protein